MLVLLLSLCSTLTWSFRLQYGRTGHYIPSKLLSNIETSRSATTNAITNTENDRFVIMGELESSADNTNMDALSLNEKLEVCFDLMKKGKQRGSSIGTKDILLANELGKSLSATAITPMSKQEAWRYTNVRNLFSIPYESSSEMPSSSALLKIESSISGFIDESCSNSCLVFVDGVFSSQLSKLQDIAEGSPFIATAMSDSKTYKTLEGTDAMIDMLSSIPDSKELARNSFASDVMTSINLANLEDAAVISIPNNLKVEKPVQVLFVNTVDAGKPTASYPRLLVRLGDNAELHLKQTYVSVSTSDYSIIKCISEESQEYKPSFVNSNTRIVIGTNSHCFHTYSQELALDARHVEVISSSVSEGGSYEVMVAQMGSAVGRVNVHIEIDGTKANSTLNGLTIAGPRQSLDLHSNILHNAKSTSSRQQQRNVIGVKGEAIFKGRIRIPTHAQKTDSDQLCRTIMIGAGRNSGRLIAMPVLEITADDVTCSHGASVADLDEQSMFYLSARGITRNEARKLLLRGFVFEVLVSEKCITLDKASCQRVVEKMESLSPKNDVQPTKSSQKYTSM